MMPAADVRAAATSPASSTNSCEGFAAYQREYEDAIYAALLANPGASEILSDWDASGSEIEDLTSFEFASLGQLFRDAATELEQITPPPIATEWHELQVEQVRTFARFLGEASTVGVFVAGLKYSTEIDRQNDAIDRALIRAGACPQFVAWAQDD